jgi:nicotinamidase-related amidase
MPKDHGSFPHRAKAALLLTDVINDFDFPDSDALLQQAIPMAKRIATLKRRARKHHIPAIYIKDNFGQWNRISDTSSTIARARGFAVPPSPRFAAQEERLLCTEAQAFWFLFHHP